MCKRNYSRRYLDSNLSTIWTPPWPKIATLYDAFVKAIENTTIVFETLAPKLVAEDDLALWRVALAALTDEFEQRVAEASQRGVWAMVVGSCFPLGQASQQPMERGGRLRLSDWL